MEWTQEMIDDEMLRECDDELDLEAECGRWDQNAPGGMRSQCRLAGTEWCDWECPLNGHVA